MRKTLPVLSHSCNAAQKDLMKKKNYIVASYAP